MQRKFDHLPREDWDVIIVGAGPAGLSTASFLAKFENKRCLLLEQHETTAGGCMHSFPQASEQVCSGVHYISLASTATRAIFDDLTDGQNFTHDSTSPTDTLQDVGDLTPDNLEQVMGIKKSEFARMSAYFQIIVLIKLLWWPLAYVVYFCYWLFGGKQEVAMNYIEWCKLKSGQKEVNPMWSVQSGDHGMPPEKTCALAGAGVVAHYRHGQSHPEGGWYELNRRVCKRVFERGCFICIDSRVDELTFAPGTNKITGVVVHGRRLTAPVVAVSGAHCLAKLLGDRTPPALTDAIKLCGLSPQFGGVFLTYRGKKGADLDMSPSCKWIHDKYFVSCNDTETGCVVYILYNMPYVPRGPTYLAQKEEYAETAKEYIFNIWPKAREFDSEDAATPATTEKWVAGQDGASYGLGHVAERFSDWATMRALRPEVEGFDGLFLIGQDVLFVGVVGNLFMGIVACEAIMKRGAWALIRDGYMDRLIAEYKKKGKTMPGSSKAGGGATAGETAKSK